MINDGFGVYLACDAATSDYFRRFDRFRGMVSQFGIQLHLCHDVWASHNLFAILFQWFGKKRWTFVAKVPTLEVLAEPYELPQREY
jgi:hypothetical protein